MFDINSLLTVLNNLLDTEEGGGFGHMNNEAEQEKGEDGIEIKRNIYEHLKQLRNLPVRTCCTMRMR